MTAAHAAMTPQEQLALVRQHFALNAAGDP